MITSKSKRIRKFVAGALAFFVLVSCSTTVIEALNSIDDEPRAATAAEKVVTVEDIAPELFKRLPKYETPSETYERINKEIAVAKEKKELLEKEQARIAYEEEQLRLAIEASGTEMEPHPNQSTFKSYMDYSTVTDRSSAQYAFLQNTYVGDYGIMMYNGCYVGALGTGYASSIGDKFTLGFEDGQEICLYVGDFKANAHTDSSGRIAVQKNDLLEFIVDTDYMSRDAMSAGSFNVIFEGRVNKIIKHN